MTNSIPVRVYVAGPISGYTLQYLENMRRMIALSTHLFMMGFSPFCPCLDYQFALMRPESDDAAPIELYYKAALSWLQAAQAALVLPGWENSIGTKREIALAKNLKIPTFYTPENLLAEFGFPPDPTLNDLFEKWEGEA